MRLDDTEADAGVGLDLLLEVVRELLVALRRDNGQGVDLEATQADAVLVHAEAKTTADRLATLALGADVAQPTDLEDVRVVPALAQSGVGEDELERRLQAEQPLLVLHDQVVGAVVRQGVAASVLEHLDGLGADLLPVDGEVAVVDVLRSGRGVDAFEEGLVVVASCEACVLLLEDSCVVTFHRVAIVVVAPVVPDGVDEEEGQDLDSLRTEPHLLVEVLANGPADHLAGHGELVDIAPCFAFGEVVLATGDTRSSRDSAPLGTRISPMRQSA